MTTDAAKKPLAADALENGPTDWTDRTWLMAAAALIVLIGGVASFSLLCVFWAPEVPPIPGDADTQFEKTEPLLTSSDRRFLSRFGNREADWRTYYSTLGRFQIELPGPPVTEVALAGAKTEADTAGDNQGIIWHKERTQADQRKFLVAYTDDFDLPPEETIDAIIATLEDEPLESQEIRMGDIVGRRVTIRLERGANVIYWIYVDRGRAYYLGVSGFGIKADDPLADRVQRSWRIEDVPLPEIGVEPRKRWANSQ